MEGFDICVGAMTCRDPFISYLKSFGYSVVRLPRGGLSPLQLLARNGRDLDRLGTLDELFVAGSSAQLPDVTRDNAAARVNGQRTGELSAGVGLSILGSVLGAMGASAAGVTAKYTLAKAVVFEFDGVLEDSVSLIKLDQFLGDADVNPQVRTVGEMLEADELFIVTATLKSTKFTLEAKRSDGTALALQVPEIQGVLGGDVQVSSSSASSASLSYEGSQALVFGFQAVQLFYEDGQYTRFRPVEAGKVAMRGLPGFENAEFLTTEGPFARMRA